MRIMELYQDNWAVVEGNIGDDDFDILTKDLESEKAARSVALYLKAQALGLVEPSK